MMTACPKRFWQLLCDIHLANQDALRRVNVRMNDEVSGSLSKCNKRRSQESI